MIISRRQLARAKVEKLKRGYSAYAETREVSQMIEKKLDEMDLSVHIDRTPIGCWFIPENEEDSMHPPYPPDGSTESPR
ncbi:hypothetical protein [Paludifilum halophilum]|uniref:Uncharacterized protein n=1 Tax=Paludifilum halophilum TaxID=1642702 RepID=A0A235B866_9BACL|nr:hypothetical protein [Paludifilum halophilum]OYD08422.1 hypothetical protein CHM34_06205 [Paludifilum halophilum]